MLFYNLSCLIVKLAPTAPLRRPAEAVVQVQVVAKQAVAVAKGVAESPECKQAVQVYRDAAAAAASHPHVIAAHKASVVRSAKILPFFRCFRTRSADGLTLACAPPFCRKPSSKYGRRWHH